MKSFIMTALLSSLYCIASSQGQKVKGHVYSLQAHQPLTGATVETADRKSISITDSSGYFAIHAGNPQGLLKISIVGYKSKTVKYDIKKSMLNIQMESDPLTLNEVRVSGYGGYKTNKETAGAIALLDASQIKQSDGISLQDALNSVPGVRMDQSTLSDSRISIRGSGVRSPWGIRNTKIYINDIPLTEADGTSRIEGLDVNDLGQAEIIKGPASSIYGGGIGGVINFKLERSPYQEQSAELSTLIGSFGLRRVATTYRNGNDKTNTYISYGWQQYDGYREHSSDLRNFMTANIQIFPSDKETFTILINRTSQKSQIPGSLTLTQVEEDRKQANSNNLDKKAGRNENWTRVGIGHQYRFSKYFSNQTSVFTYFYDLDHPLPYAYLHTFYQSYGGRTKFDFDPKWGKFDPKITWGAEFNQANSKGTQYVNNHGEEGNINSNTDYRNVLFSLFGQSEISLTKKTMLAAGISFNGLTYHIKDYLNENKSGIKKFNPQASPRVALSHDFGKWLSLHGSISSGFSPPTGTEISNEDGTINQQLQGEKAANFEIDAKGNFLLHRLAYDLALFRMNVTGELIPQSVQQGITVYHNSGKTQHDGIELSVGYQIIRESDYKSIKNLRPYLAVTYSDFTFNDYKVPDGSGQTVEKFNGNKLTGIAPWVIDGGVTLEMQSGIYGNVSLYYSDKLPLNDQNTDYNPAYFVANFKIGYKMMLSKHFDLDIYAGINNINNAKYSSFTSLNAVAYGGALPAYFNPNPIRNGYTGLNFKYNF